ncbi:MAG: hypothetical protein MUC77_05560 [Chromatiaceae bacterium]|jgi:hypothetical protein|nr:hypothetical protein [Chromatiaceae bacterium]
MLHRQLSVFATSVAAVLALQVGLMPVAQATEIKGGAILDHPCGKVSVKHMGLVNAGKMDEALALSTPEMQAEWKAMPADEQNMISGMMQAMSQSAEDFAADIKEHGVLVIDGQSATLTVQKMTQDAGGVSTSIMTEAYQIDGSDCAISR